MELAVNCRFGAIVVAGGLVSGCAGYNLRVGTSGYDINQFQQVYSVPATSLQPWADRIGTLPLPPPPDDGSSGASTLPVSRSALPSERPSATATSKPGN